MKEVFANFMALKIVNPAFPTVNHDSLPAVAYPAAYEALAPPAPTRSATLENLMMRQHVRRGHLSLRPDRDAPFEG